MKKSAICPAALVLAFLACLSPVPVRADGASPPALPAPRAKAASPPAVAPKPPGEAPAPAAAEGSDRSAEYPGGLMYTVVEGDTLWDLSAKYLGSPWKWPVLWERNRFLTNPHYIYPGIRLEIFPPPAKEYAALPAPPTPPAAAPAEAPKPPEEAPPPPPVRKEIVPLLDIKPADYVRAGEFLRERPRGIGAIVRGDEDRVAFSTDDKVFLSLSKDLPAGQMVGVYRVRGPVVDPADRTISGYVKYLIGVIQLTSKENGVPAGTIRAAFEDLLRTDMIAEEIPAYAPVPLKSGAQGVEATVISGRDERSELAAGDFVYLS
ncbi:MAG: LysM peptidoglycan-binding domain-containing protein, partial [Deltaproteobacteria bacterium]|nr:LysM peptidoglycan-binding domain-containing protein [Deltaproteobacteria bacterium]